MNRRVPIAGTAGLARMAARAGVAALACVAALASVTGLALAAGASGHKPHKPPLPRRLEIDENDQGQLPQPYSLRPSHNPVGAGKVQFNVYNFGQDAHTLVIFSRAHRRLAFVQAPANQPDVAVPVSVKLAPGRYTLECTLPGHASLGMRAVLVVR